MDSAVSRGTLLCLKLERDGKAHERYILNDDAGRRAVEKIKSGELQLGALAKAEPCEAKTEQPDIFTLYEKNIGMLTPIVAEELKEVNWLLARWIAGWCTT